ncbi:hypothetical protein KSMBR1_3358 [Candidatus Kuenenia stuttgartiensis]|jgi:hypothetical protein|uniref:Uncharacterized protein n=1 Tax=Kuenenia stuttgartiensis TaxID=174633 RepID=A0A2C9CJ93_KUEST|nr:hypothetical protein KSMBR1_3358 [Candidatus Kuenenia stuttgartiensis]
MVVVKKGEPQITQIKKFVTSLQLPMTKTEIKDILSLSFQGSGLGRAFLNV